MSFNVSILSLQTVVDSVSGEGWDLELDGPLALPLLSNQGFPERHFESDPDSSVSTHLITDVPHDPVVAFTVTDLITVE